MSDGLREGERRVGDDELPDFEALEGWQRLTDEPGIYGVEVFLRRFDPSDETSETDWSIGIWMAGLVREDPLESELREGIAQAVAAVPGVTAVQEDDREVWIVTGDPDGLALLRAATGVVDSLGAVIVL